MAAKNSIIGEWINGGRVEYSDNKIIIIEHGGEWLIQLRSLHNVYIHIAPGKFIALKIGRRWYVSHAPHWRGRGIKLAREMLYKYLPRRYYYLIPSP